MADTPHVASTAAVAHLLEAQHLAVSLGSSAVLVGVDLTLGAGELLAVRGASGSGKSTLLHVLAGLISPEAGEVRFRGQRTDNLSDRARSALRLRSYGFVFQSGDLLPELTVAENVGLPLRFLKIGRGEIRGRVRDALDSLGILHLGSRALSEVSGGQLQRAAIARAMIHGPAVVFADEPTGSLDDAAAQQVLEALIALARERSVGVLLVTHSDVVAEACDRSVNLSGGRLTSFPSPVIGRL
jgi:putative ABC transport system ATP-binding protein